MSMKAILGCMMFLSLLIMPVFAQEQPPSAEEIVSKMQSTLNLTSDQVSEITPIIEKYTSKFQELRQGVEDGTVERSDMRTQMKELKSAEKSELSPILTPDQLNQWEQMQGKGGHHHGGGEGGGNGYGSNGGGDTSPQN